MNTNMFRHKLDKEKVDIRWDGTLTQIYRQREMELRPKDINEHKYVDTKKMVYMGITKIG